MTAQVVALYGSHSEMLHFLSLSPEIEGDTYYIYKMSWPYEMTMSTLKSAKKTNSRLPRIHIRGWCRCRRPYEQRARWSGAHGVPSDVVGRAGVPAEDPEPDPHAQDPEAAHGQAHDRSAQIGDDERLTHALLVGGPGRAGVALGGCHHPEVAREHGAEGPCDEAHGGLPVDPDGEQDEYDDHEHGKGRVLTLQEGHGPGPDVPLDLLHQFRAIGLLCYPLINQKSDEHPEESKYP